MSKKNWVDTSNIPELSPLKSDSRSLSESFHRYLINHLGHFLSCQPFYIYEAMAFTIRDRVMSQWNATWQRHKQPKVRKAYYMSLEFLIGRALGNHIRNLDLEKETKEAMEYFSVGLEDLMSEEPDAGLGNGGLGRLAACFIDSCATLELPVIGYGIRYEYGMFRQKIERGFQVEEPDHWLRDGNPWEIARPEYEQTIHFGGRTEHFKDPQGNHRVRWVDTRDVIAIPHDLAVSGYRNQTINTLRLWKSSATDVFNLDDFNAGSYSDAVESKNDAEHISMVLYPNDSSENGKELRLRQQYFLASASLKDVFRLWEETDGTDYSNFAEFNVFQMNDTHPTIAVAELMRLLMDEKHLLWDEAWAITIKTMAYTNHTLLPEALETWPVALMERLLPRLMEIIYHINEIFLREVAYKWPGDTDRQARMSIIGEQGEKKVRMAFLAIVGSFSVNGVAKLHSELLCDGLFKDFYELYPKKFNNKTNGVTPRRWIASANPEMSSLINEYIGDEWVSDLTHIHYLKKYAEPGNDEFQKKWFETKYAKKVELTELVKEVCGVDFNPDSMFDVQVKRIHEYKRQLLNILHVIHLYNRIKKGDTKDWTPRNVLIGGKAAPGYHMAKLTIKFINNVAKTINTDPDADKLLKVAFFPNFNVSAMEVICPATDLSEQISTAGKEASGTGNMKFMMNGAVTIGTYDGANIEILDHVGEENFFLFGLKADEVSAMHGNYDPQSYIDNDEDLADVISLLESNHFNLFEPNIFHDIISSIRSEHDPWLTLADFRSYVDCQEMAAASYRDREGWIRKSILNTASSGYFSTDRTIGEYNKEIWKL